MIADTKAGADASPVGRIRAIAGAILAPLSFVVLWLAPLPLETEAHRLVAIFAAVLIAWVSEVVPVAVTALMIGPALVVCGVSRRHAAGPPSRIEVRVELPR